MSLPAAAGPLGARNPNVQHLRRLLRRRSARSDDGVVVVEGVRFVRDALDAGVAVRAVYVAAEAAARPEVAALAGAATDAGVALWRLAPGALEAVATTTTPQPVLAVVEWRPARLGDVDWAAHDLVLVLDGVADPGNAGTLLRVAEAAGATAVVTTAGSVDVTNPKAVRAGAGSLLRLTVAADADPVAVAAALREGGLCLAGTVARAGDDYAAVDWPARVALVLGSEAHGLGAALEAALDLRVTIPMAGAVESLNAAIAGAVVAFEVARRRRPHPDQPPRVPTP